MQEVFEKIIEKLEEDEKHTFDGCINKRYAIEIVKQEAERCKGGHFGCNTNGEHEKCNGCGLTYCKSRNKIWFGALDDGTDTNAVSNGWIPCSGCADCNHKECVHYKGMTQADRIRSMSDEELTKIILCPYDTAGKPIEIMPCVRDGNVQELIPPEDCKKCMMEWLNSEAEG